MAPSRVTWPEVHADALIASRGGRTVVVHPDSGRVLDVNESAAFVLSHRAMFADLDDAVDQLATVFDHDRAALRTQLTDLESQVTAPTTEAKRRDSYLDATRRNRPHDDIPTRVSQRYSVDALGVCVHVVSHDVDISRVLTPLLVAHPSCDRSHEQIDVWRGRSGISVALNSHRLSRETSVSMAAQTIIGLLTALAIDNGADDLLLHAAAVELAGTSIVLAGPSGAGKSSTAVEMVRKGAGYMSDELVRIETETRDVVGFPRAIGLEGPARLHHEDLRPSWWQDVDTDRRWTLSPHDVGRVSLKAPIGAIVHLEQSRDDPPLTERLAWPEALTLMMPVLYHRESLTQAALDRLVDLLSDVPCVRLRHTGSRDAADRLTSLARGTPRVT